MAGDVPQSTVYYTKDDAYQSLQIINSWIGNMDTKISFALAFVSVLIGFIFSNGVPHIFKEISQARKISLLSGIQIFSVLFVIILYLLALTTIAIFVFALSARVQNSTKIKSVFFFGDIAMNTYQDLKDRMDQITDDKLLADLQSQIWINSKICSKKAKWFNLGLYSFLATMAVYFICAGSQIL